ncbi:NAD(P)-dependent oxidoreductase [Actinomadura atramentaria]|uniref:NAD(P)-dependent oxidoreductase n=1 Tax=Actinomadura atramentaria TaxID=1990 RepID=UPI00037E6724|nr:SDR family oxidoreductase [Actinomadura atramentaria]
MQLTVLGATGGTGLEVVRQARERGHAVTAVVRDPDRLPAGLRDGVDVVRADVMDPGALAPLVKDRDAVISALGSREGRAPTTVCTDGARSAIAALRETGGVRLLTVSASGAYPGPGDDPFTRFVMKPLLGLALKQGFVDTRRADTLVAESGLDWTIVRPPRLLNGPAKGSYRTAVDRNIVGGISIRRADLAAALLDFAPAVGTVGRVVSVAG